MSEEIGSETVMRKSLDAIDGMRRRMAWAGYLTVAGTIGAFFWLNDVARRHGDVESLLMAAVLALTAVIAWSTFASAIFMLRMTKRILRAIDLASRR